MGWRRRGPPRSPGARREGESVVATVAARANHKPGPRAHKTKLLRGANAVRPWRWRVSRRTLVQTHVGPEGPRPTPIRTLHTHPSPHISPTQTRPGDPLIQRVPVRNPPARPPHPPRSGSRTPRRTAGVTPPGFGPRLTALRVTSALVSERKVTPRVPSPLIGERKVTPRVILAGFSAQDPEAIPRGLPASRFARQKGLLLAERQSVQALGVRARGALPASTPPHH